MQISTELLKGLAEIGFLACFRGLPTEAVTIFEGISQQRPDNERIKTGLGIAYMNAYRVDEAIVMFREVLRVDPNNANAKSFLGLALKVSGKSKEGDAILKELVAAESDNKDSKDFANAVLTSELFNQTAVA